MLGKLLGHDAHRAHVDEQACTSSRVVVASAFVFMSDVDGWCCLALVAGQQELLYGARMHISVWSILTQQELL